MRYYIGSQLVPRLLSNPQYWFLMSFWMRWSATVHLYPIIVLYMPAIPLITALRMSIAEPWIRASLLLKHIWPSSSPTALWYWQHVSLTISTIALLSVTVFLPVIFALGSMAFSNRAWQPVFLLLSVGYSILPDLRWWRQLLRMKGGEGRTTNHQFSL